MIRNITVTKNGQILLEKVIEEPKARSMFFGYDRISSFVVPRLNRRCTGTIPWRARTGMMATTGVFRRGVYRGLPGGTGCFFPGDDDSFDLLEVEGSA